MNKNSLVSDSAIYNNSLLKILLGLTGLFFSSFS